MFPIGRDPSRQSPSTASAPSLISSTATLSTLSKKSAERIRFGVEGKQLWDRWLEEGRRLWEERGRDSTNPLEGPEPQFFTYRDAWAMQFERSFRSFGADVPGTAACARLLDQLAAAACFPEVPEVLEALRGTYRIAVLSNADDDFLSSFLQREGLTVRGHRFFGGRALL